MTAPEYISHNNTSSGGLAQFRRSLSRADKSSLAGMYGFIVLLHLVGFGVLFAFVVPNNYNLGGDHPVFTIGVGIWPTRWDFATPSTPTTLPPSTTPRAN